MATIALDTLAWGTERMPKSFVFEKMLELAMPIVKSYRSDLFHDANFLNALDDENVVFFFTVRNSGTWIDRELRNIEGGTTYRFTITCDNNRKWTMKVDEV